MTYPWLTRTAAKSIPEEEFPEPRANHPKYVSRYTCGEGEVRFAEHVARRRTRAVLFGGEPKLEVAYDRLRHVIRIREPNGKIAEFDDRPVRLLVMDRNPVTKALEPVTIHGQSLYDYQAREIL